MTRTVATWAAAWIAIAAAVAAGVLVGSLLVHVILPEPAHAASRSAPLEPLRSGGVTMKRTPTLPSRAGLSGQPERAKAVTPAPYPAGPVPGRITPSPSPIGMRPASVETPPPATPRGHVVSGVATYFASPSGVSAAGPALRAALGPGWRGTRVTVCAGVRCVVTVLGDWCACGPRPGGPTVIDLDDNVFAALAPLSRGVIRVTVAR
jgi:hypothetical protein